MQRPRPQFHHVNDVVPTIYEIIGITPPRTVNGVEQDPIDGVSFAYSFADSVAKGRLLTQYFEIMGSRAIYHDDWMACVMGPRLPWVPGLPPGIREWTPDKDVWELYNLAKDWSQANDLAAKMPEKLAQMKDIFLIEAAKNKALPIGGGLWIPVLHPELRVAPPYTEWTFASDMVRMPEFCAPALGNKPNIVTIDAVIPDNANGVLYKLGANSGGLTCFVEDGVLCLRIQPLHHSAHQDPRQGKAADRQGQDRDRDPLCRAASRRSAENHDEGGRQGRRGRRSPDQRSAALHRQ